MGKSPPTKAAAENIPVYLVEADFPVLSFKYKEFFFENKDILVVAYGCGLPELL